MRFFKIITSALAVSTLCAVNFSCVKNDPVHATTEDDFSNTTLMNVFNATVKATRNYVYVDGAPVSGVVFGAGSTFPNTAYAFRVKAGLRSFSIRDTLITSTQVPLNFVENLDVNKFYTIFTYDSINAPKQITVLNNIQTPTGNTSMLRFANFIYNTNAMPNVDVYSYRITPGQPVFSNVQTTGVTNFIPVPAGFIDTLYVYAAGTTSPLIAKAAVAAMTPQRSYTAVFNGSYRSTTRNITTVATY